MPPSASATTLDRFRAQLRDLQERPEGPSGRDVERMLNDVYAEVIGLEVIRTRTRRRLLAHLADDAHAAHEDAVELDGLDAAIDALRAMLADLRALPVGPSPPDEQPAA